MYRSDHEAALARATAAHERLCVMARRANASVDVPPPEAGQSAAELLSVAERCDALRGALAKRATLGSRGPAETVDEARVRYGAALSDWYSLGRAVRSREAELIEAAAARGEKIEAADLIGERPRGGVSRSIEGYAHMTDALEQRNARMRSVLEMPSARSVALAPVPSAEIVSYEHRTLEFREGASVPWVRVLAGLAPVVIVLRIGGVWLQVGVLLVVVLIVAMRRSFATRMVWFDERAINVGGVLGRPRSIRFGSLARVGVEKTPATTGVPSGAATLVLTGRNGREHRLRFTESAPGSIAVLDAWVAEVATRIGTREP